jgi:hypothetical protein
MINQVGNVVFISKLKPNNSDKTLCNEYWILLLQEEFD